MPVGSFQHVANPLGALVEGPEGDLYMSTSNGGRNGCGTLIRFLPGINSATLHAFTCTDGAQPEAALVQGADGKFYGTTKDGGASGLGALFNTGPFSGFGLLASFDGSTQGS